MTEVESEIAPEVTETVPAKKPPKKKAAKLAVFGLGDRENNDEATPKDFYDMLNLEFNFNFDPCPLNGEKAALDGTGPDGLEIDWKERNFVNPPFKCIKKWVEKGIEQYEMGKLVVFLISARVSSVYWHKNIFPRATEIRFLEGGLTFGEHKGRAPFPLAVVIFDPAKKKGNGSKVKRLSSKYRFAVY